MSADEPYILFELAGSLYGIPSKDVLHVDFFEHMTPVPNAAAAVDGIVFSRGQVVPALNLRTRFGLPRTERTPATRLIFVKVQQRTVALIVDSAREFRNIPENAIRPIEETLTGIHGKEVRAVATWNDRLLLLLDIAALLDGNLVATPPAAVPALEAHA